LSHVLIVRIETGDQGELRVLAPKVGWWFDPPRSGRLVGPGTRVGTLGQLSRRFELLLPEGAVGRVVDPPRSGLVALEYGATMFRLAGVEGVGDDVAAVVGRGAERAMADQRADGTYAVVAPTDGVFYRASSPDEPPLAKAGSEIRRGHPVGLIEVMKTFNQIEYGGPGFPDEAEIVSFRCRDGEEVRAGQVLLLVR